MITVGPTTNTNSARMPASTMLMFDSHWMPLATPDTADSTKAAVSTMISGTRTSLPAPGRKPVASRPPPICRAPRPRDAAEPKIVAKIAMMSMTRPIDPVGAPSRRSAG